MKVLFERVVLVAVTALVLSHDRVLSLSCYEGFAVYSPDLLSLKNSTEARCSQGKNHVCLFAEVSITVFGIEIDVEAGTCLEEESVQGIECDFLLDKFNETGYVPEGLDSSMIDFSKCNLNTCSENVCNEFFARPSSTSINTTQGAGEYEPTERITTTEPSSSSPLRSWISLLITTTSVYLIISHLAIGLCETFFI